MRSSRRETLGGCLAGIFMRLFVPGRGLFLFCGVIFLKRDAFSAYHPAVNFLFFMGAIGFGVVIQHPAYLAAGCLGAGGYYFLLHGRRGLKMLLGMLPLLVLISVLNPLFNHYGERVLFTVFGEPYTLEALFYGMAVAAMFAAMMLWFGCYNVVMTGDKFTSLFGNLIPALSLLLVMVLRMVPGLTRKARQISGARKSVGMAAGEGSSGKEKLRHGMTILSTLTDWALEGSVVTADSMRARGYGSGKRSSFMIYRMTARDFCLLALELALAAAVLAFTAGGAAAASYTPVLEIAPLTGRAGPGLAAYCAYLLIPTVLHIKEALQWHILRSKL